MKCSLLFAETVPEFDMIHRIFRKEFSEFWGDYYRVNLAWMSGQIKYLPCDMERVSNDYDMLYMGSVIAWLIPYLIAKSSASAVVMLMALWRVLTMGLLKEWMCNMDIATWFFMLVSDTMMDEKGLEEALIVISSKFSMCFWMFKVWGWK